MGKAVGVWTALMIVVFVLLWVVGWGAVGSMGPGGMAAGIALFLALMGSALLWLVGVVILFVAGLFGAFRPAAAAIEPEAEDPQALNDTPGD